MIVIGIIGSPAGGKSTVAACLQELGATWINADRLARQVLETAPIQAQLLEYFGPEIADNLGRVDRGKLAARVFGDDDSSRRCLTYLEGLIHPQTRQLITQRLQEASRSSAAHSNATHVVVLDVPLLLEVGWDRCCDEVWCIDADRQLRLERAADRGWDEAEMARRENNQMEIAEKRRRSTRVIDNNGTPERLRGTISKLWSSIQSRTPPVDDDQHCQP